MKFYNAVLVKQFQIEIKYIIREEILLQSKRILNNVDLKSCFIPANFKK